MLPRSMLLDNLEFFIDDTLLNSHHQPNKGNLCLYSLDYVVPIRSGRRGTYNLVSPTNYLVLGTYVYFYSKGENEKGRIQIFSDRIVPLFDLYVIF